MKSRNVFFTAGMAAAFIAVFAGCASPLFSTAEFQSPPSAGGASVDAPSTGVQPEEFTVTLRTGAGGASRAVAGPGAGTIQYGSIRNTVQVIVVDQEGAVVDFKQARRTRDTDSVTTIEVDVDTGETYHFLVLMGHQERDYGSESPGGVYVYKTDPTDPTGQIDQAPTLLAAGFTTAEISGEVGETITVTMKPVVVDTVFAQGGTLADAALAGVTLRQKVSASLTWTVTSGFDPLISAQKEIPANGDVNTLRFKDGATLVRKPVVGDVSGGITSPLGGNAITLADIGTDDAGDGSAYFNLTYAPFNLTGASTWGNFLDPDEVFDEGSVPVWIIRNGINDEAQNNYTVFPNPDISSSCPWNGTGETDYNGNGAVRFSVVEFDQNLTLYIPTPVTGGTPVRSFAGPQYTGTVEWIEGDLTEGIFKVGETYTAAVTLTAASGWTFDGVAANSFVHGTLSPPAISNAVNSGVVAITFPATTAVTAQVVDDLDLKPYIPAPVLGGTPVLYFAGPQYRGVVTWHNSTDDTSHGGGVFEAGTQYKATVELTAASGWTFAGFTGPFKYGTDDVPTNIGPPMKVEITFPAIPAIPPVAVSDLDLTTKVLRPIAGVTPGTKLFGTQYTGTVAWNAVGKLPAVTPFNAGEFYTATVTLTARPGYFFDGDPFTHSGASSVGASAPGAGGAIIVPIDFPATAGPVTKIGVQSFGPTGTTADSALYLMNQTKDSGPLTITLASGTEPALTPGTVNITRAAGQENTPRTVTINGGNRTLESDGSGSGALITLTGDGYADGLVVTLTNITIQGTSGLDAPLVRLEGKARLVLGSGAIIQGNSESASHGGGVYIGPGSVLEMGDGSVIKDNIVKPDAFSGASVYGGGVYNDGGTFTMNSGSTLSGNKSLQTNGKSGYGGGVYINNGTFTMKTGSVLSGSNTVDNTQNPPAPVYVPNGGGVYLRGSNTVFEMSGGSITGNTAGGYGGGGVYCYWGTFKMSGGSISGNSSESGGGVYVGNGAFRMSGGAISTNEATASKGGGVYVDGSNAVFEMSGGILSENTAKTHGGGVYVGGGKFEMRNSEISSNKVTAIYNNTGNPPPPSYANEGGDGGGGGVCVVNAEFAMSGGSLIADNDAMISNGGGVHLGTGAVFTMSGGILSANHAQFYGGGVYVREGAFEMKGSEISSNWITGNNNSGGGGGVAIHNKSTTAGSGTFTMKSGAKISGNRARDPQLKAGGVLVASSAGDFKMQNGSEICENQANINAGGVMIEQGTFSMETGSSIRNNTVTTNYGNHYNAGGLYLGSSVTAPVNVAGVISGNKVVVSGGLVQESGGGVYNASTGTFTLQSGGAISGNEVTGVLSGGGVCHITGGTFTMEPGSSINNNKVYSWVASQYGGIGSDLYIGGGVYLSANQASMIMNGSISYNEANYNGTTGNYVGGGVLIRSTSEPGNITISGSSVVTYNKAGGNSTVQGGILTENTTIVGTGQMSGNIP